jgi:hypothetical protein
LSSYLITYDIREPSTPEVYDELHKAIKSYGTWAHITESCWAIVSDKKATEVRDHLEGFLRSQDRILVLQSANVAAWRNVICRNEWLKEHL